MAYIAVYIFIVIALIGLIHVTLLRRFKFAKSPYYFIFLLLVILLFPIPIRHAVICLFGIIRHEVSDSFDKQKSIKKEKDHTKFLKRLEGRFSSHLTYQELNKINENWRSVEIQTKEKCWLNTKSNMLWHAPLVWSEEGRPTLGQAKMQCKKIQPYGAWALPTESENYFFWKARGEKILPESNFSSIFSIINIEQESEIATIALKKSNQFVINCVARTKRAPLHGYTQDDIPLSEWNRYQLHKF